jgi:hypothetical protein
VKARGALGRQFLVLAACLVAVGLLVAGGALLGWFQPGAPGSLSAPPGSQVVLTATRGLPASGFQPSENYSAIPAEDLFPGPPRIVLKYDGFAGGLFCLSNGTVLITGLSEAETACAASTGSNVSSATNGVLEVFSNLNPSYFVAENPSGRPGNVSFLWSEQNGSGLIVALGSGTLVLAEGPLVTANWTENVTLPNPGDRLTIVAQASEPVEVGLVLQDGTTGGCGSSPSACPLGPAPAWLLTVLYVGPVDGTFFLFWQSAVAGTVQLLLYASPS